MRLYASADIHGSQYRLNIILKNIERYKPDIVVICGDITQFGPGSLAKTLLDQIPIRTLAVHGNIDTSDVVQAISNTRAVNMHLRQININNESFIGIGGDIPTDLFECKIKNNSATIPIKDAINSNTILISHVPPYNTMDKVFIGRHIGSKELLRLVEETKPRLVLCGHVHEDPGVTRLNKSIIVNCSIGKRTEGAVIDINNTINVKIID
jgi:Icc-related predicted phosphoesterase